MLSVFCSPSRYTQGKNATASLGHEMAGLGLEGPALIVAGRSAISLLSESAQTKDHAALVLGKNLDGGQQIEAYDNHGDGWQFNHFTLRMNLA
jgi:glycerol dehydrogenase